MTKAFKIQKAYVNGLATWLNALQLGGRDSRERTRFVSILADELKTIDAERVSIIEKYVTKDENNEWQKIVDSDGLERWDVPADLEADLNKDVLELYQEDFVLDIGEEHLAKIKAVRDIVLNTDFLFGPSEDDSNVDKIRKIREANDYEEWCKAFEALELGD